MVEHDNYHRSLVHMNFLTADISETTVAIGILYQIIVSNGNFENKTALFALMVMHFVTRSPIMDNINGKRS